jgi:hypothetical protein
LNVPCANDQAQRGSLLDDFDPSVALYKGITNACFYEFGGTSTCAAAFAGDADGFGPARRFCCCVAAANSGNTNDAAAAACPATGKTASGAGGGGGTVGGVGPDPADDEEEDDANDSVECAANDVLCTVLTVGRTLFDLYLTLCGAGVGV